MLGITIFGRRIHQQRLFDEFPVEISPGIESVLPSKWQVEHDELSPLHLQVEPDTCDGHVALTNLGKSVQTFDGVRLHRGQKMILSLPALVWAGETLVRIFQPESVRAGSEPTAIETLESDHSSNAPELLPDASQRAPGVPTLVAWFESLTELQRGLAVDDAFFRRAARALFDPGGFDAGLVLLQDGGDWKVAGSYIPNPGHNISWNPDLLEQAVASGETLYELDGGGDSGQCISAIAPFSGNGLKLTGAVCGVRTHYSRNKRRGIRPVEAHFLRLVGQTVSMAIDRARREQEIAGHELLLRQLFPPRVVESLKADPGILDGREQEVSAMFVDLRNYSSMAGRLPPRTTWQMVTDLMETWTDIIVEHSGVIVDYYGDGLAAFWNAPMEVEGHAVAAVRCAWALRRSLPELNERWSSIAGMPLEIGIGIASGIAQVGNCGSRKRIKYGPHGTIVNLARRLESLSPLTGVPILVSEGTARMIEGDIPAQRVFNAAVKGLDAPQPVWQPVEDLSPAAAMRMAMYELALQFFESGDAGSASRSLGEILESAPQDPAARFLLGWIRSGGGTTIFDGATRDGRIAALREAWSIADLLNRQG